ncbi:FUSC family membrane protein [Winogradskyella wichelsiae]|uniref:FUSC family membrane protein n=1 Tax=Winogradskyella wichelsiae TaxID=2697007 RepID=UPI0015CB04CB|nr:FUSC family membrane protein [Winogradskyella wichelsiae]
MKQLTSYLKQIPWLTSFRTAFLSNPNRLLSVKATFVIGLLIIIMVSFGLPFYAVTLGLGALAGALSETDDHPKGRLKSLALKVVSFAIASFSVELLQPYPVILGIGLSLSTIVFILIGGVSERFRGVTFGALLVGIYTMIGTQISPNWYLQPILLTSGAFIYGTFSYILLRIKPYSLLEEQLARGFAALSLYFNEKSKLFPSTKGEEKEIRTKLALLNVQTVEALDRCKEVLNSYGDSLKDQTPLKPYFYYFMVLQSLHERATSSHERYDLLSENSSNKDLIGGIRQLLKEISTATQRFGNSLLTGMPYKHPTAADWLIKAVSNSVKNNDLNPSLPIKLLIQNLSQSHYILKNIKENYNNISLPKLEKETRSYYQIFKLQLNIDHPKMRYALKLSLAFLISYATYKYFNIEKGEWIVLTVLLVLQPSYSETRKFLLQRILGTLAGVVSGIVIIKLFTFYGQIALMIASAYLFFFWLKRKYSISVIYVTFFVMCAFNIIANKGVDAMGPRLVDTVLGAFISFLVVRFLWPNWQYKKLPSLLSEAVLKNSAYLKAILNEYEKPLTDDLDYRIARREAHRADNALVKAWQNMQLDPKKHQKLKVTAFRLTYLNHALLSYLSALGAHRAQNNKQTLNILSFENHILKTLEEAFNWLTIEDNSQISHIEDDLEELRQLLHSKKEKAVRIEYSLLFNITEVTQRILKQAQLFKLAEGENANK